MASATEPSTAQVSILPSEISMLADDLAGACDTGIEFLQAVGSVTVVLDPDLPDLDAHAFRGLVVWNTESRALPASEACRKVVRACRLGAMKHKRVIVKKTDSAFRGNFAAEIATAMDALDPDCCCLVPAIPDFGRVTRNGIQYIDGEPIAESFYSRDPKHPVSESRVAQIASAGHSRPVGLIDLEQLRSVQNDTHLQQLLASGVRIIVVDGESRADIERAVKLCLKRCGRIIFVGGQGVGNAVAECCGPSADVEDWTSPPHGGLLVACGTLHPRARQQLSLACRTHGIEPAVIPAAALRDGSAIQAAAERSAGALLSQIEARGLAFLASPEESIDDPSMLEEALALTVGKLREKSSLCGVILTGGTTAYNVCRHLGITVLNLRQRISWGVVLAQSAQLSGMAVGVKGGSLGETDSINQTIAVMRSLTGGV
jgi:uncharacterized protein YgbK (DUF1537 family)